MGIPKSAQDLNKDNVSNAEPIKLERVNHRNRLMKISVVTIVIIILSMLTVVAYYYSNLGESNNKTTSSSTADDKVTNEPIVSGIPAVKEENGAVENKALTYLDISTWDRVYSKNKVYSIKLGVGATYGYCNNDLNTIAVGLIYIDSSSSEYDCGDISTVIYKEGRNYQLARLAVGLYEQNIDVNTTPTNKLKLAGGQDATRYEYTSVINNKKNYNVEYVTEHDGVKYAARLTWADDEDISSYVSPEYLDTIVAKTWVFN